MGLLLGLALALAAFPAGRVLVRGSNKEYSVLGNLCKKADGDNPRSILGFASSDRTLFRKGSKSRSVHWLPTARKAVSGHQLCRGSSDSDAALGCKRPPPAASAQKAGS